MHGDNLLFIPHHTQHKNRYNKDNRKKCIEVQDVKKKNDTVQTAWFYRIYRC